MCRRREIRWDEGTEVIGGVAQRLRRLALLGAVIVVCAAMLAAVAAVPVLVAGGVARAGSDVLEGIEPLVEPELPERNVLLAADGSVLGITYTQNREHVELSEVPDVLVSAIIAVEDARFYEHRGVDVRGTLRALRNNADGGAVQGGSTITQQYVKNVLALSAENPEEEASATERTPRRKLIEAHHALELESELTKDEILERYLNLAYLGGGAWGVQAAAQTFFGVDVGALTLPQAALIAGQLQSPARTDPFNSPERALERRNVVLARMAAAGVITGSEAEAARVTDLGVVGAPAPNGCSTSPYPFYCDWVLDELEDHPALGDTAAERVETLQRGGLTVVTALDPREQAAAQAAVDTPLGREDRVAAATTVIEPGTGAVRAMAVNRNYGTDGSATVFPIPTTASHPAGSTFKIFTLTAALEAGIRTDETLPGGAQHTSEVFDNPERGYFTNAEAGGATGIDVAAATIRSQNTGFVQLTERTGVPAAADAAVRLGIESFTATGDGAPTAREGSFPLGARSASTLEMANVAATLAAGGVRCEPTGVAAISFDDADPVPVEPRCARTIDASVAATVSSVLAAVVTDGTGRAAAIGRPVAGKTGTSQNFGSAWFVGYTPQRGAAVMLGDPRGVTHPLLDVAGRARVFGGGLPAEIFAAAMGPIHEPFAVAALPGADPGHLASIGERAVPHVVGLDAASAAAVLDAAGYRSSTRQVDVDGPLRDGVVVNQAVDGDTVTLDITG